MINMNFLEKEGNNKILKYSISSPWRKNAQASVFVIYTVASGNPPQVFELGSKSPYPLSHITIPLYFYFLK